MELIELANMNYESLFSLDGPYWNCIRRAV